MNGRIHPVFGKACVIGLAGFALFAAECLGDSIQLTTEYQKSQQYLSQQNYEEAINALNPLLSQPTLKGPATIEMATLRNRQADYELTLAQKHFQDGANLLYQAVQAGFYKGPEVPKVMYDIGRLYEEKMTNLEKAQQIYKEIIQNHPGFLTIDSVTYRLASILEKLGRSKEAVRYYNDIVTKYAFSSYLNVAQDRLRVLSAGTTHAKTVIEMQENLVENAKTDAQAAKASLDLANMYLSQGEPKKAISEFKRLIADPPSPEVAREAYAKMANLLEKEKDYQASAQALEDLVQKYPNDLGMEKNLFKLGRIYEKDIEENTVKKVRDGQVLLKKGDDNARKAVEYYNQLTETYPDADVSADAYLRKGELYESRLKDPEQAKAQYEEFLNRFPNHQEAEKIREKLKKMDE